MKLQHTPGPWSPRISKSGFEYIVGSGKYPLFEFGFCKIHGTDNIAKANARLIAAAPDMLNELIVILDRSMRGLETSRLDALRLKNIIESATGMKIEEVLK